jgi:hypothetical protein
MSAIDTNTKLLIQNEAYNAQSKAIHFSSGAQISFPDSNDWDFGTGAFCFEGFIKFIDTNPLIVFDNSAAAAGNGVSVTWYNDNTLRVYTNTGGPKISRSFTPALNKWYHIAYQRDGSSNLTIWLNGVQQGASVSDATNVSGSSQPMLMNWSGIGYTAGSIRKYNRISNIARYTATFTPSALTSDANTLLLLLGEETNGATSFTDSSSYARTGTVTATTVLKYTSDYRESIFVDTETTAKLITDYGDAKIVSKLYNKSAAYFDGASRVRVPNHADFSVFNGDFTIEAWVMYTTLGAPDGGGQSICVISNSSTDDAGIQLNSSNQWTAFIVAGNAFPGAAQITTTATASKNTWYHIAFVRSGNNFNIYVDGTSSASTTSSYVSYPTTYNSMEIGSTTYNDTLSQRAHMYGWMKEFRVSNSARYTGNFTPSTTAFTSDANTKLLLHFDTPATAPLSPAIKFDGTGDYLTVPDSADWDFGTGDFTIELWYRFNAIAGGQDPFFNFQDFATIAGWKVAQSGGNLYVHNNNTQLSAPAWAPVTNRWYHIALCRSGSTARIFVDGVQLDSFSNSSNMTGGTSGVIIGTYSGTYLNGWMKQVRISNSARYTAAFTPSQTPFVADSNTKLLIAGNESNGVTTFVDTETTPKTITTNGNCVISYETDYRETIFKDDGNTGHKPYGLSNSRPKVDFLAPFGNGAAIFDGTGDYLTAADSADWDYGTGDFAHAYWFRFPTTPASCGFLETGRTDGVENLGVHTYWFSVTNNFYIRVNATDYLTHSFTPVGNVWYYAELNRSGTDLKLYINGSQIGSTHTDSNNVTGGTVGASVGSMQPAPASLFNGMMDNIVVVKGAALHTTTFNPPTEDYSSGGSSQGFLSFFFD